MALKLDRVSAVVVAIVLALAAAGCGDESEAGGGGAFGDALEGLKEASLSGGSFNEAEYRKDLTKTEDQVLRVFCDVTRSVASEIEVPERLNSPYFPTRIETQTGSELNFYAVNAIREAVGEVKEVFALPLKPKEALSVAKTCEQSVKPVEG